MDVVIDVDPAANGAAVKVDESASDTQSKPEDSEGVTPASTEEAVPADALFYHQYRVKKPYQLVLFCASWPDSDSEDGYYDNDEFGIKLKYESDDTTMETDSSDESSQESVMEIDSEEDYASNDDVEANGERNELKKTREKVLEPEDIADMGYRALEELYSGSLLKLEGVRKAIDNLTGTALVIAVRRTLDLWMGPKAPESDDFPNYNLLPVYSLEKLNEAANVRMRDRIDDENLKDIGHTHRVNRALWHLQGQDEDELRYMLRDLLGDSDTVSAKTVLDILRAQLWKLSSEDKRQLEEDGLKALIEMDRRYFRLCDFELEEE